MEDDKFIKLDIKHSDTNLEKPYRNAKGSFLQTNPILQKMFLSNILNKKNKFSFKDLFR